MHCLSAKLHSNLLVKSLLTISLSIFNSSAIILMSKWRHFPHNSPHLSHIFITFQCCGTVRSFIVFHILAPFQKSCGNETPYLHTFHITNWRFWGGSFLQFHKKFDVFSLLNFVSGSTLTSTYLLFWSIVKVRISCMQSCYLIATPDSSQCLGCWCRIY